MKHHESNRFLHNRKREQRCIPKTVRSKVGEPHPNGAVSAKNSRALLARQLRLPKDYPWVVLTEVSSALSDVLEDTSLLDASNAARQRNVQILKDLDQPYGLRSINRMGADERLKAASRRLISSLIIKHEGICLGTPAERKDRCLRDVISLDTGLKFSQDLLTDPVFIQMKRELRRLLGDSPNLEEISEYCRHGPGSSTEHAFEHRSSYFKYLKWPYACSPRAGDLLRLVIQADPRWVGSLEDGYRRRYEIPPWRILNQDAFWKNVVFDEVPFNIITSVPKDGTKDRPIAIEPPGNVFLQLGIDAAFRRRLRVVGNSIDNQEKNRLLALLGSKSGLLATLDLSNASDTLHRELVRALLPEAWFELLDRVRSPFGLLPDGTAWRYAKMSSMGNATTFVLETAVFWAAAQAVSKCFGARTDTIAVFGDDIIIDAYLYRHLVIYLELMGCQPNEAKSFAAGPVRESCGVDAFDGSDIRPVFLKRFPQTDLDIYSDRNRLHLWWKRHVGLDLPARLDAFFFKFLQLEPMFGPTTPEDVRSHLFDEAFRGHYYEAYTERTAEVPAGDLGFRKLMHTLRGSSEGGMFAVSRPTKRLSVVRLVSQAI